jgi:hypothetical protein
MQGPVAIILIFRNVIFISETGYWTRVYARHIKAENIIFDIFGPLVPYVDFPLKTNFRRIIHWIFLPKQEANNQH